MNSLFRLTYSMKYVVMLEWWSDWFYLVFECVFPSIRYACWANERIEATKRMRVPKKNFFSKNWKPFCILLNFFPTILATTMWRRVDGDAGKYKFPLCDRFWLVEIFVDANESWWSEWNLFFIWTLSSKQPLATPAALLASIGSP